MGDTQYLLKKGKVRKEAANLSGKGYIDWHTQRGHMITKNTERWWKLKTNIWTVDQRIPIRGKRFIVSAVDVISHPTHDNYEHIWESEQYTKTEIRNYNSYWVYHIKK